MPSRLADGSVSSRSSNRNILRSKFTLTASNGMSVSVRQVPSVISHSLFRLPKKFMDDLRFHCVICGRALKIASSFAGGVIECPSCLRIVPIPSPLHFPHEKIDCPPVLPREILAVEIKILCGKCDTKIRLDARMEGYRVNCPVCAAELRVPMWSRPADALGAKATTLSAAEIEFLSASAEPIARREPAA